MADKKKYGVKTANNLALGQNGVVFEDTGAQHNGYYVAIQCVNDCTFSKLNWGSSADADNEGPAVDSSNIFPAGMVIYGPIVTFALSSGVAIAYKGDRYAD